MRLLVTRPEPGASATAARIVRAGGEALVAPLLAIAPLPWSRPAEPIEAVMLTSANAARAAGPGLAALTALPCFAVGEATAAAARAAGFADVRTGGGSVAAVLDEVAAAGLRRVLHLAGEDRTEAALPEGLTLVIREVYRAVLVPLADDAAAALAAGHVDAVLLASARTARQFASECARLGLGRSSIAIAAISPAVAAAAGGGWRRTAVAAQADEAALLAAAGLSCEKGA